MNFVLSRHCECILHVGILIADGFQRGDVKCGKDIWTEIIYFRIKHNCRHNMFVHCCYPNEYKI